MPDLDGAQATAAILQRFPKARVLMLTTFDADEERIPGARSGALGFFAQKHRQRTVIGGDPRRSSRGLQAPQSRGRPFEPAPCTSRTLSPRTGSADAYCQGTKQRRDRERSRGSRRYGQKPRENDPREARRRRSHGRSHKSNPKRLGSTSLTTSTSAVTPFSRVPVFPGNHHPKRLSPGYH